MASAPERLGLILVLRPLVLAGHHHPRGKVGEAHRAVGGVNVLTASAAAAVKVNLQILLSHLHDHRGLPYSMCFDERLF